MTKQTEYQKGFEDGFKVAVDSVIDTLEMSIRFINKKIMLKALNSITKK